MKRSCVRLLATWIVLGAIHTIVFAQKAQPSGVTHHAEAVKMFLQLFDVLDEDRDGIVPLVVIFEALNLQQAEARQIKRARALDGNSDGKVTYDEARAGIQRELTYQTNRGMNTDADGDDILTPQEYALSFADPNGKPDASGLTLSQQRGFREDDLNGDGKVTRNEIEARVAHAYEDGYWVQWMAARARRADRNRDGFIDEREFASLEALPTDTPLPPDVQKRFLSAGAKDGRLPVSATIRLFPRQAARAELEKRMTAFESQLQELHKSSEGAKP
jgi:Ca2+-binding EF-hand superfamily protein